MIQAKNSTGTSLLVNKGAGSSQLTVTNQAGETPHDTLLRVSRSSVGAGGDTGRGHCNNTGVVHWLPLKVRNKLVVPGLGEKHAILARARRNDWPLPTTHHSGQAHPQ